MLRQFSSASQPHRPTIKLIGDTSQNITELVKGLGCSCGLQNQIRNILEIYVNKIHKLRLQRDQLLKKVSFLQSRVTQDPQISYEEMPKTPNISKYQQKQSEINIFQLLSSQQLPKQEKQNSLYDFSELSQSQISQNHQTEEESLLLTLQNTDQKNENQFDNTSIISFSFKKNTETSKQNQILKGIDDLKTPKKQISLLNVKKNLKSSNGNKSGKNFQEFLEDKITAKFSANRYKEDICDSRKRKNKQKKWAILGSGTNENGMRIQDEGPKVSQFRLPLQEWTDTYNLGQ